jgi:hypothetical protein
MTDRDWFAAFALAGILASHHEGNEGRLFAFERLADDAFDAADAMLAKRSQQPDQPVEKQP